MTANPAKPTCKLIGEDGNVFLIYAEDRVMRSSHGEA